MAKIVIIEDNSEFRLLLKKVLEKEEVFELTVCENGREGLEAVERERPDMVLLDIMMPGIDGHEVCRKIRSMAELNPISIIFITALTGDANELAGLVSGANAYVTKPIDFDDLLYKVNKEMEILTLQRKLNSISFAVKENFEFIIEGLESIRETKSSDEISCGDKAAILAERIREIKERLP